MSWIRRVRYSLQKQRLEENLHDELQFHIEMRTQEFVTSGMAPEEARRHALKQFGNSTLLRERTRDMDTIRLFETLLQDLRYGLRMLRKAPGFTTVAVLSLALGIGANTAIFSVINGVILRPLPYPDPERLVSLEEQTQPLGGRWSMSYLNFLDCERDSHSFQSMAGYLQRGANLTAPGEPIYVGTRQISAGFFSVLGMQPAWGRRAFLRQEDQRGAAPVAIISHSFWQERFRGDPETVGAKMTLNGKSYTIVGVLPSGFPFFSNTQILTPMGQNDDVTMRSREIHPGIWGIARLKPGISMEQARSELTLIGRRLAQQYPDTNGDRTFGIMPLKQNIVGNAGPTLFLLAGAVGLVLLIACANVGNLFLARSISRSREFAIRAALGAGRGQVVRQVLTESTLLGLAGGLAGLLLASVGTRFLLTHLPGDLPRMDEIAVDIPVLLFTLFASVFTGIVFGLAPALRQRLNVEEALKLGARGNTSGLRRLQSSFVVAEVALAFVLLAGSGLMLRTILKLWSVNPGFDPHGVLVTGVGLSPNVVKDSALMRTAWQEILNKAQMIPGVESAAVNSIVPFRGDENEIQYWTGSAPPPLNQIPVALTPSRKNFSESAIHCPASEAECPWPGSGPAGLRHANHGTDDRRLAGTAAPHASAVGDLCRRCAHARLNRHLWRCLLRNQPTRCGDRYPNGTRSSPARCSEACDTARARADNDRPCPWAGWGACLDLFSDQHAIRDPRYGPGYVCRCGRPAWERGAGCGVCACTPRITSRSDGRAEIRVNDVLDTPHSVLLSTEWTPLPSMEPPPQQGPVKLTEDDQISPCRQWNTAQDSKR